MLPPIVGGRAFRDLWLGQTISVFGDQVTLLAIPIIAVLTLGATPEQMGLLTAAGLLAATCSSRCPPACGWTASISVVG